MSEITQMIADTAARYGVDPVLAIEVATAESGMNPNTPDSPAGAVGLFQLMPKTAEQLGVNPRDPAQNTDGGVRYLSMMLGRFGDIAQVLGAYDWGPTRVERAVAAYGANWLDHAPGETQGYVRKILHNLATRYHAAAAEPDFQAQPVFDAGVSPTSEADSTAAGGFTMASALLLGFIGFLVLTTVEEI